MRLADWSIHITHTKKTWSLSQDEMVDLLYHKSQKQTHRLRRQISKETNLTKCSFVQIIQCIFGRKCILFINTHVVSYCFFFLHFLQGSVTTQLMCAGIFNNYFIVSCLQNATLKIFKIGWYLAKIETIAKWDVFWDTVYKLFSKFSTSF